MLAYPLAEAEELLRSKLTAAQTSLSTCEEDLDFLREQITVSPSVLAKQEVWYEANIFVDDGGRHCARIQLGCGGAEKGEGGREA